MAIRLAGVSKMYKIYPSRLDNFLDALGLARLMPWRRINAREFWALRDINFELKAGSRLGIIGRNGAGKSTLLKLITGNLAATEGEVYVDGQVQALLEAGAGFHPEFTGYENIRAALTYQGFNTKEIEAAIEDIAEFTELGQFLAQPFKTYSAGMQARLVFATATTLKPDILIIDEILGAGDAYFAGKSAERMKDLVEESGASVLLVSHAMEQILRYCDECIWVERGRIVKRGPSLEVIKAYQQYIQILEDRRLKAKNQKRRSRQYQADQYDIYADHLVVRLVLEGLAEAQCHIAEIKLWGNDQVQEQLLIGDAQDTNIYHPTFVILDGSNWSKPQYEAGHFCRSLVIDQNQATSAVGNAIFYLYSFLDKVEYNLEIVYNCHQPVQLAIEIWRNGTLQSCKELPTGNSDWITQRIDITRSFSENGIQPSSQNQVEVTQTGQNPSEIIQDNLAGSSLTPLATPASTSPLMRWPSEGSLTIEEVLMLDGEGRERAVFHVGTPLNIRVTFMAHRSGTFEVLPTLALYRLDGTLIFKHPGHKNFLVQLEVGQKCSLNLTLGSLNLGDGYYIFSVALFRTAIEESQRYDLIDRSYEFQVIGNDPIIAGAVFKHPGEWGLILDKSHAKN